CYCARRAPHSFPTRRSSDLERGEDRGLAEISAAGVADGRGLAVVVGMVFLDQGVVALTEDPPGRVVDHDGADRTAALLIALARQDRKSTRLNSSHVKISYAV